MNIQDYTYENRIADFISKNPRNKLVVITKEIEDLSFIILDRELSLLLNKLNSESNFSLKAKDIITYYLKNNITYNNEFGKYLAISHIGILLEKELKFDFISFLNQYSQNQSLFLKWEGEIEKNKLYFLTKENGVEIDISDLSHIII